MIAALAPAAIVGFTAFYGTAFGSLVPTNEALESAAFWAPVITLILTGMTFLIARSCTAPIIRDFIPDDFLAVAATIMAGLVAWAAAPNFLAYGLPAFKAGDGGPTKTIHVVHVIRTDPVCATYRGVKADKFGAVVRSDTLGGPRGSTICRIPPSVWEGLVPGDRLTLHGYLGSSAFHYNRITHDGPQ